MWLMIAYKRQKCQNKMKQKGRNLKNKKIELGRAFANLALAKAQVKNKRSSNFRHKKDIRQARNSKPAINLQKWITKTAKNYQKDKIRQALQPRKRC